MGAFQEERQVLIATPFCKFAHAIEHVHRIPFYVEMAVRNSIYGRPGASYLDIADDIITGKVDEAQVEEPARCPDPPRTLAMPEDVEQALDVLRSAERPLVIVGKGMAYSRAEDEVREFIERTKVPFLASPMGKGVMPDNHPLSVGAARSHALQNADVVFLMGARLNWIMHFGLPPRFNKNVRIIQLDISPEQIGQNAPTEVALVGDGKAIVGAAQHSRSRSASGCIPKDTPWHAAIAQKAAANAAQIAPQIADDAAPANYYRALKDVAAWAPEDAIIIGEGASTMDIGRTQLLNSEPRHRLDAGSYGTMGIGMGFVVAAAVVHPDKPIISVSGDSAIGFSGMEIETVCRYKLPVKIVVFNNGGIGPGHATPPAEPAAHHEAERADLRRALRQDDGGLRRQGLLHRGAEGSQGRAGRGDGLHGPGARQRADLAGVGRASRRSSAGTADRLRRYPGGRSVRGGPFFWAGPARAT